MEIVTLPFRSLKTIINSSFSDKEPWQIVTFTTSSVLLTVWLWDFLFQDESLYTRGKKTVFRLARLVPSVKQKLDAEMEKIADGFVRDVQERTKDIKYITVLPQTGRKSEEVLDILTTNLNLGHYDWKNGRVSGSVYFYNQTLIDLITKVYGLASYTNPLHPDVFPGVCKMEAEVVKISANLFRGGPEACGTMTTGGTESIIMACKAYRDYAREIRGVRKPEIIMPVTAHTGFEKAAQYLGLRVKTVPVDPYTLKVDVKAMERAISSRTVMLVGSAPNFPYGTMDDIESISYLGFKNNIPVHVDACLGGFLIVFMEDAGYPIPPFDFRLPGVTSISADTHKYGFAPKGSSVVLYREPKYRHYQFTVSTDWPGGVYGSPTVSGSRAGGIIATCWATFLHFGYEGYIQATRDIIHTTHYIEKQLRSIEGIFIFGKPATSVIAIGSKIFDIYRLSGSLGKLGWNLNVLQFPSGIHICVTHMHTQPGVADKFITDVRREITEIMKNPGQPIEGKMAIYGVAQQLSDRRIVGDFTRLFLDSMYYTPKCHEESSN